MRHLGDSTLDLDTTLAYKVKFISEDFECEIYSNTANSTFKGIAFLLSSFVLAAFVYYIFLEKNYTASATLAIMFLFFFVFSIKLIITRNEVRIYKHSKKINIIKTVFGKIKKDIEYKFDSILEIRAEYISNQRGRLPLSYQKRALKQGETAIQHYPEVSICFKDRKTIVFLTPWSKDKAIDLATKMVELTGAKLNNSLELTEEINK
ncbi:MAG: hypothetical protein V4667_10915 [Bacteroidota bacterium]